MGQKRPKLPWLPAAKSTTEQRVKFVPKAEVVGVDKFQQMPFVQCPFKYNRRLPRLPVSTEN
jgi:hypothetical protein